MASKSRIRYRDFVSVPIKQLQELHLLILYFDTSGREDVMRMVFEGEVMRLHGELDALPSLSFFLLWQ